MQLDTNISGFNYLTNYDNLALLVDNEEVCKNDPLKFQLNHPFAKAVPCS